MTKLIRISPDGKEIAHLHDDKLTSLTRSTSKVEINRASNVFFDNDIKRWRVRVIGEKLLPATFLERDTALAYEKIKMESKLRAGEEVCVWKMQ